MKTETFDATVSEAYGKKLDSELKFTVSYDAFENYKELETEKALPSNDEIVKLVNNKRKASARATATTKALEAAGIAKPDPNSIEVVQEKFIALFAKQHGLTIEQATNVLSAATAGAKAVA